MLYNTLYDIIRYYTAQSAKNPITQIHNHNPCVCVSNNSLVHLGNMCHNLRSNFNSNVIFTFYEIFH